MTLHPVPVCLLLTVPQNSIGLKDPLSQIGIWGRGPVGDQTVAPSSVQAHLPL
jgi:hypothetical protein